MKAANGTENVVPTGPPVDRKALRLSQLFEHHYDAVFAYGARRIGPDRASDLAAEVFAVAWRRIEHVPATHEKSWLISTARNLMRQDTKQQFRRQEMETLHHALEEPLAAQPDLAARIAEQQRVEQALSQLSDADRELVTLVAWDGMSLAEAAQVLDCKPGTARVRWMRARARLARLLDVEEELDVPGPSVILTSPATPLEGVR